MKGRDANEVALVFGGQPDFAGALRRGTIRRRPREAVSCPRRRPWKQTRCSHESMLELRISRPTWVVFTLTQRDQRAPLRSGRTSTEIWDASSCTRAAAVVNQ